MALSKLAFLHFGGGADPIQDLVDEYKAYVATQSGTIGVSDAALYAEYQDMITKGEITNTGINTKNVRNFGLWGYKLSGSNATHMYGLVKVAGNYPVHVPLGTGAVYNVGGYFEMSNAAGDYSMQFNLDYGFNPFYIDLHSHTRFVTGADDILQDSTGLILRFRTWAGHVIRVIQPIPEVSSAAFFLDAFQISKFKFDRFNDGAEKVSIKVYQNGSLINTFADRAWVSAINGNFYTRSNGINRKHDFKYLKAALQ